MKKNAFYSFVKNTFAFGLILVAAVSSVYASAGDFDMTFNGKGYSIDAFSGSGSAWGSAVQPDGKVVIAGYGSHGQTSGFTAVRLNTDGSIDQAFGKNGKVLTSFGGRAYSSVGVSGSLANAVTVQPDGKIVLAGQVSYVTEPFGPVRYDIALARYNSDGTPDAAFGEGGKLRTSLGAGTMAWAAAVAMTPGGKIQVYGTVNGVGTVLVRYNPDGALDVSLDWDGRLVYAGQRTATAMVVQPDGKTVVTGSRSNGFMSEFETARFNFDGTVDTTFNGTGVAPVAPGTGSHSPYALLLQPDGKIIVEGAWNNYIALMRYNPDGTFDNSFGEYGFAYFSASSASAARAALMPDGKIVIAGGLDAGGSSGISNINFWVFRLNSDGSKDLSFNGTGSVSTSVSKLDDIATGVIAQSGGKTIVTGYTKWDGNGDRFVAVRYNPDSSLDASFGTGGKSVAAVGYGNGELNDIVVQDDGKIVAVGGTGGFAIARYKTDGTPDTAFNGTGTALSFRGTSAATAAVIDHDGKILVAGRTLNQGNSNDGAIVRYNSNGSADDTFGSNGQVVVPLGGSYLDSLEDIAVQPDGKIVVAGYTLVSNPYGGDIVLMRFNPDGSFDTTFDGDGKVLSHLCGPAATAAALAIQADGKIVIAGSCDVPAVFRFNADGSPDTSFNKTGVVTLPGMSGGYAADLKVGDDGAITIAGEAYITGGSDFFVARLLGSGAFDPSLNGAGVVIRSVNPGNDGATSLAIQPDGKIVAGGYGKNGGAYEFKVLRFNNDGTPDNGSWGNNGVAGFGFDGDGFANAAAIDADGRVLVGGYAGGLFGIARLNTGVAAVSFVSVSGRVTDAGGRPINRANVSITDANGLRRTAQTNPFGYYRFDDVQTGAVYMFTVSAKGYRFSPRQVTVGGELTDLDFTPNS